MQDWVSLFVKSGSLNLLNNGIHIHLHHGQHQMALGRNGKFSIENLILSIISLFFLIFYFDYNLIYGGGFFYKLSILIFENNYLFYIFFFISLNAFILIFANFTNNKGRFFDLTLFLILIFLEIDHIYFHETYDPLLYFVYFLLIRNRLYFNFAKQLILNNVCYLI